MSKSYLPYAVAGAAGAIIASALPLLLTTSRAETRLLPFQGRLTNAAGTAIDKEVKVVEFKMYDAPTGGTVKWSGEVHKLSVNGGLVNTMLGSKADLSRVDFSTPTYLQITVDAQADGQSGHGVIDAADPPLLPRQSVVPAVYAIESGNSRKLNNADWSAILTGGSNDPVAGTLRGDKLAEGSVGTAQLGANAVSTGQIVDGTIQVSDLSPGLQQGIIPPGTVVAYAASNLGSPPPGWAECRGASVSRTSATYAALFAVIGTNHGSDSPDTFNLPDYRGLFLRGIAYGTGGTGNDPDRQLRTEMKPGGAVGAAVGSIQSDDLKSHTHPYENSRVGGNTPNGDIQKVSPGNGVPRVTDGLTTSATGGKETRPKNAYVNYIIKL